MPDKSVINHVIILMMENRSFDHYFGYLPVAPAPFTKTVEGFGPGVSVPQRNHDAEGTVYPPRCLDGQPSGYPDPPHGWDGAHASWNDGHNDGFVSQYEASLPAARAEPYLERLWYRQTQPGSNDIPMGYYTEKTLPVYYELAKQFIVVDNWFSSVMSSTFPNRKYLLAGVRDNDNDTGGLPPFPGFGGRPIFDFLESQINPDTGRNFTWKCYFTDMPFLAGWYEFAASHLGNFKSIVEFANDCREDNLPDITIIDPSFILADDHPCNDPILGQKFIGLVVDALTNSESFNTSALFIVYDENGGFFDHVSPPPAPETPLFTDVHGFTDFQLGFRVPALVVSPYARCNKPDAPAQATAAEAAPIFFDHTSLMQTIHQRWGVTFPDEFGERWKVIEGLWDYCFDFNQPPLARATYTGDGLPPLLWGEAAYDLLRMPPKDLLDKLQRIIHLPDLSPLDARSSLYMNLAEFERLVVAMKSMSNLRARSAAAAANWDKARAEGPPATGTSD